MIVIKDMKMPSSCYDCPFVKNERTNDYGSYGECGILEDYETINLLEHSKHPNCPLVDQEPVIDKIRTEIQKLRNCSCNCSDGIIDDVEDILDKYKGESEG